AVLARSDRRHLRHVLLLHGGLSRPSPDASGNPAPSASPPVSALHRAGGVTPPACSGAIGFPIVTARNSHGTHPQPDQHAHHSHRTGHRNGPFRSAHL